MATPDLYWRKALIYCQLARQQTDQAALGLDLLREIPNKDAATNNFVAVASVVTGDAKPKSVKKITTADPVLIATMKLAGLPTPAAQRLRRSRAGRPARSRLRATARSRCRRASMRAERAFAAGLIPIEELIALYQLAPSANGDPVAAVAAADSPLNRAALYKAAAASTAARFARPADRRRLAARQGAQRLFLAGRTLRALRAAGAAGAQPRLVRAGRGADDVFERQQRPRRLLAQPGGDIGRQSGARTPGAGVAPARADRARPRRRRAMPGSGRGMGPGDRRRTAEGGAVYGIFAGLGSASAAGPASHRSPRAAASPRRSTRRPNRPARRDRAALADRLRRRSPRRDRSGRRWRSARRLNAVGLAEEANHIALEAAVLIGL